MAFKIDIFGTRPTPVDRVRHWLARPLSGAAPVVVLVAALASVAMLAWAVDGPALGDASLSIFTTWLIAHANLACAYPAKLTSPHTYVTSVLTSPLYPMIAAAFVYILRIGHGVPFPNAAEIGHACANTYTALDTWANNAYALQPTLWIGMVSWVALVVALFVYLKVNGDFTRRRAVVLIVGALGAPVYLALMIYFHPQDLLALSFIVFSLVGAARERWLMAGIAIGLGLLSQQFVVLAAIPLLFACPRRYLARFLLGAVVGAVPIGLILLAATSGSAILPIILGSDRVIPGAGASVVSQGGSWLWELHLHGAAAFFAARVLPVAASLFVSLWARRRWDVVSRPETLVALVGLSLSMRLVFEQNIFSYYFVGVFVMLVLVAATLKSRVDLIALWIAVHFVGFETMQHVTRLWSFRVTPSYDRIPAWGLVVILLGLTILNLRERRVILYQPVGLVIVVMTSHSLLWGLNPAAASVPYWFLQLLLVPWAIALFVDALRNHTVGPRSNDDVLVSAE